MAVTARRAQAVALPGVALPWAQPRRGTTLPKREVRRDVRRRPAPGAIPRAERTGRLRARRRGADRAALMLAAIAIAFAGAFVSLSQSVRVSASSYDIVRLISERDRLEALRRDLQNDVDRLAAEPAIRKGAISQGLGALGAPVVIESR